MNNTFIEFKKQRDFGQILSDTFGFIRNEFKPFMKAVFGISAPALLLFVISLAFYTYTVGDTLDFDLYSQNTFGGFNVGMIVIAMIAYMVSMVISFIFISSTTLHYIREYVITNGSVDYTTVKQNVYKSFWGYLGLGFLKYLSLGIATALCFFPVLYVMVPMFIVYSIYVFEPRRGAVDSYSYSFYLINEDFWLTLGLMIVFFILMYILSMVFSIPTVIYMYVKMGIFSGEIDITNYNIVNDPVYLILNVISTLFSILLNLIFIVSQALVYFHLNEKKNFTGTYERIGNIGKIEE